jgi:hypothetical protein
MVAQDMSYMVEELGGAVVGPAGELAQGLALAESEQLAGAILDINLNGENTFVLECNAPLRDRKMGREQHALL